MADAEADSRKPRRSIERARLIMEAHDAVAIVRQASVATDGTTHVYADIEVPMPNTWKADGASPTGVLRIETVRLDFPASFPLDPPEVSLRPDFDRSLAHMQPWVTPDGRPVPCVQDGRMSEFFRQQGIAGVMNQLVLWLDHAAQGLLIDPAQGWEPTRRDFPADELVANANALKRFVDRRGGYRFTKLEYLRLKKGNGVPPEHHGRIYEDQVALNKDVAKVVFREGCVGNDVAFRTGVSLAVTVWPGKDPSGKPVVCDAYLPETVTTLDALKERAALYGCESHLSNALRHLAQVLAPYKKPEPFALAVILCARRPFNLIGTDSPIELCSYIMDIYAGTAFPDREQTAVRPAGIRHHISPDLLGRMSDIDPAIQPAPWTLIGCGSLGSKVALHMARAGLGPQALIDQASMSPHNFARHALIPRTADMQILSMGAKAQLLREALAGLDQEPIAIASDIATVLATKSLARQAWSKHTRAVVNTTASLRVRAALCESKRSLPKRVIEALLFSRGKLGLIATEGPDRNPNSEDLFAMFFHLSRSGSELENDIFAPDELDVVRTNVGEGCGSPTMTMSDGRISIFAAGISEYLLAQMQADLPCAGGELTLGELGDGGLGVSWRQLRIPPVTEIPTGKDGENWTIRIHEIALQKINEEVGRWPAAETGGVLLGRHEEVSRSFHVVDVFPAPPDSVRSASEFRLGIEGLATALSEYAQSADYSLYCLGTWHSHLHPSGPSDTDRQTACAVALARLTPSVLLIHTPKGFRAVLADRASLRGAPK